jgi:zinc and cadmium transporter
VHVLWSLGSVFLVSLIPLAGLATARWSEARVRGLATHFVSFAVGALFGDAFIHLIPESYERVGQSADGSRAVSFSVLGGILGLMVLETLLSRRRFRAHPEHAHDVLAPLVVMNLVADGVHNLIDGVLIAASYQVSLSLGVATTVAVLLHELPQEIADFGILVHRGLSVRRAVLLNALSGAAALVGAGVGLVIGAWASTFAVALLPVAAGAFIYIAGSHLVPELQHVPRGHRRALGQLVLVGAGITVMGSLALIE